MSTIPVDVEAYLVKLSPEHRFALESLRDTVLATCKEAVECISYQLPAFRYGGKVLLAYGATAKHCALYPMSGTCVEQFTDSLAGFDISKGTIRFSPQKPIPKTLLKKIIKARMAENVGK